MPTVLCVCVGCFVWCVCVHWDFSMKNAVSSFLIHIFPPKIFVKTEYHVLWPVVRLMLHQFGEKWSANSTQVKNEGEKDARIDWVSQWTSKSERGREREKKSKSGNRSKGINSPKPLYCNFFCVFFSVSFEIRHYRCVAFNLSFFTRKCVFVCVPVFWSGLDVIREAIFCDCVFLLLVVYCAPLACYLLSVSADPDAILFVYETYVSISTVPLVRAIKIKFYHQNERSHSFACCFTFKIRALFHSLSGHRKPITLRTDRMSERHIEEMRIHCKHAITTWLRKHQNLKN